MHPQLPRPFSPFWPKTHWHLRPQLLLSPLMHDRGLRNGSLQLRCVTPAKGHGRSNASQTICRRVSSRRRDDAWQ